MNDACHISCLEMENPKKKKPVNIAVFVSGGGSDLQSIIDAIGAGQLNAKIALVVSSNPDAYAIERAKKFGIPCEVRRKADFYSPEEMFENIMGLLRGRSVEYIVLAGYLSILTPNIISAYKRKIINIHPSLIPKFCGDGMYGMRVHRAVIQSGEKVSGATVHFVDEGTDTGPIIAQEIVPVLPDDTPETLQARVLELEHRLLPQTLAKLFN